MDKKRSLSKEIQEGFDALAKSRTGNLTLKTHHAYQPVLEDLNPIAIHGYKIHLGSFQMYQSLCKDAKESSLESFLDKWDVTLKNRPPVHDRVQLKNLDPSEWEDWRDWEMDPDTKGKVFDLLAKLKQDPNFDLPPIIVHGLVDDPKFRPQVIDGHHRVAAYKLANRLSIPVWYDTSTLTYLWKECL